METLNGPTKKHTVVVIDDSPMLINFLEHFLSKEYNVKTYTSTSSALKDLADGVISPDLILTDFYLGNDLTGLDFIQQFKEIDPVVPILVLSGSCDMNQKVACLQSGAADFVPKPFNPMELHVRMQNAFSASQLKSLRHAI